MVATRVPRSSSLGVALKVGDVVTVGRACLGNPAGARAVVVEIYDLGLGPSPSLLFPNGASDGFGPQDLAMFDVQLVGHEPALAGYQFTTSIALHRDWRDGQFTAAWKGGAA